MKIGVCEGSPRNIQPDHLGHADYLGVSINQSARYMDASAHGGMVRTNNKNKSSNKNSKSHKSKKTNNKQLRATRCGLEL